MSRSTPLLVDEIEISRIGSPVGLLVFNPLSWARTGRIEFEAQFPSTVSHMSAIAPNGKQVRFSCWTTTPPTAALTLS